MLELSFEQCVCSRSLALLQRPLSEFFPDANPLAIDLLTKMLKFNPEERITVVQALAHPYLAQLHNPVGCVLCWMSMFDVFVLTVAADHRQADEPICSEPFNFDFERESLDLGVEMPKEELQRLVFRECLSIHQIDAQQMH